MKGSLNKFEKKSFPVLSKEEMKQVKGGGVPTFGCRNGATGYGYNYNDVCGSFGVAWINFNP